MDTRSKILSEPGAARDFARPLALATGYFDVLRAEHVRELRLARDVSGAHTLLVVILPREKELVEARARAEVVAALRLVDGVLCAGGDALDRLLDRLRPDYVTRLEHGDARRLADLRQRAAPR